MHSIRSQRATFAAALLASTILVSAGALAQSVSWNGIGDGENWEDPLNWTTELTPEPTDDALIQSGAPTVNYQSLNTVQSLIIEGQGGNETFFNHTSNTLDITGGLTIGVNESAQYSIGGSGSSLAVGGDLILGQNSGSTGTFNISGFDGDTVSVAGTIVVGDAGNGFFNHNDPNSASQVTAAHIVIGRQAGGFGQYTLGNLAALADDLIVGDAGAGTFDNNGGSHTVTGNLILGNQVTGDGTYNLTSGGQLTVSDDGSGNMSLIVGNEGTGTFNHTSGSAQVDGDVIVASQAGSTGTYTLNDGSLNVNGGTKIGLGGTGTFTQDGAGTTHTTSFLDLGGGFSGEMGTGTYNLVSGTLSAGGAGIGVNNIGTFNHSGGTFNVGDILLGNAGGGGGNSQGYYNLSGTGVLNANNVLVSGFGYGEVNQSGGTANIADTLLIASAEATGGTPPREGHYNLSGGDLNTGTTIVGGAENGFTVGPGPLGFFNQTGGVHNTDNLIVGEGGTQFGGQGQYVLDAGALNVLHDARLGSAGIGVAANGTFTQNGGSVTIGAIGETGGTLFIGSGNGVGTYNMNGGTLTANQGIDPHIYVSEGGTGAFNQTGGDVDGGFVHVGTLGSGTGVYTMSGGTLDAFSLGIGSAGATGTFTIAPGAPDPQVTLGDLFISGDGTNLGSGLFDMQAGSLTVTNNAIVGDISSGAQFKQSGGTAFIGGNLIVGNNGGVDGTYDITGGSLQAASQILVGSQVGSTGNFNQTGGAVITGALRVGLDGTGTYTQDAGTVNAAGTGGLVVGSGPFGNGTYNLNGGGLFTDDSQIGFNSVGTFNHSGGTHNASLLSLGQNGGTGAYNLSGTGDLDTGTTHIGGGTLATQGMFTQTGGTHDTAELQIAVGNGSFGTYQLDAGTVGVTGNMYVGFGGTGQFTQTGGTIDTGTAGGGNGTIVGLLGNGTYDQSGGTHNAGRLVLGQQGAGVGTYNLTGGTLNDDAIIGDFGTGTQNTSGGTHNVTGNMVLGNNTGSTGTYNLSNAGTLAVTGNIEVGKDGAGHYNQSGGTATVGGQVTVKSGTGTGEANLSGGTLQAATLVNNDTVALSGTALTANVTNAGTFGYTGGSLTGNVTNSGAFNISGAGTRTVDGQFSNQAGGTVKVTDTTAVYTGLFTNAGAYQSDPATNVFLAGLTVGPTGTFTGGAGDVFEIHGNFINGSTDNTGWDTDAASLDLLFDGAGSNAYQLALAGIDLGQSAVGLNDNFSFFDVFVEIGLDDTLLINDGNGGNNAAFYVHEFLIDLADLLSITSDFNIYYDATLAANAYLGCQAHDFGAGGGQLLAYNPGVCVVAPAPEPGALPLMAGGLGSLAALVWLRRRRRI